MASSPPAAAAAGTSPGKSPTKSPSNRSASPGTGNPVQPELVPADENEEGDADSTLDETESQRESTASIASSILQYRTIQGRTFHSERHDSEYFTPNDEQQSQSVDITHHFLGLLLSGKLFLAPIEKKTMKVLDVGTGTGIWAIDFADEYPEAEVIGTDLSPIQPHWIPPNLKFEIDDCTKEWTYAENTFDFVHMRFLFGAIADWPALFKQAYRSCKPGGWVQTGEAENLLLSDDGTVNDKTTMGTLWNKLFTESAKKMGRSFTVLTENLQRKGMEEAGFTDIEEYTYKVPMNAWPKDKSLAEVGRYVQLTMENDIEGYTLFLWKQILGWPDDEYQIFLMMMRKELRNRRIHSYFLVRYVYGRKPEEAAA